MKSVLKIWSILIIVAISYHLAQAADSVHSRTELDQNITLIQKQMTELEVMQEFLADVEDTNGLMSAIGQTIDQAEMSLKNIKKNSDLNESRELKKSLSSLISQFKAMDPLNQILGAHVHRELNF